MSEDLERLSAHGDELQRVADLLSVRVDIAALLAEVGLAIEDVDGVSIEFAGSAGEDGDGVMLTKKRWRVCAKRGRVMVCVERATA